MNYHKAKSTWQRKILVMGCLKFQNEQSNKNTQNELKFTMKRRHSKIKQDKLRLVI